MLLPFFSSNWTKSKQANKQTKLDPAGNIFLLVGSSNSNECSLYVATFDLQYSLQEVYF